MDTYLLPATRYEPPARQVRKHILNTIIEDERSDDEEGSIGFNSKEDDGRGRKRNLIQSRSTPSTSPVPSLTSSASSYFEDNRQSRDFDELYDVSEDDSFEDHDITPGRTTYSICTHPTSPQKLYGSNGTRNRYPSLAIPSPSHWPTIQKLQQKSSVISPARPPKIPLSPAVLSLLNHGLPSSSQPPSLDGSLNSDPHASTAPTTPEMPVNPDSGGAWGKMEIKEKSYAEGRLSIFDGSQDPGAKIGIYDADEWENIGGYDFGAISIRDFGSDPGHSLPDSPVLGLDNDDSDPGIQLPPEALITLQHLSLTIPSRSDIASDTESIREMEEVPFDSLQPRSVDLTPVSHTSEYSLDQLSIPSPGGFFSSLASNARHTWCFSRSRPPSLLAPTTAIAEQFYDRPWSSDHRSTVEQIIEVDDDDDDSNGPPTARQVPFPLRTSDDVRQNITEPLGSPVAESTSTSDEYQTEYHPTDGNHFDRTTVWLAAQSSYMSALRETNPVNKIGVDSSDTRPSLHLRNDSLDSPMKKAVRFLENEMIQHERKDSNSPHQGDSIYYHAFQHLLQNKDSHDAFQHRQTRSDSVQAARLCLPHEHLDRLQGNYTINSVDRPNPLRPVSMFPGKDVDENEEPTEQKVIGRVE